MKKVFKRIISIILLTSMICTSHGVAIFAEDLGSESVEASAEVNISADLEEDDESNKSENEIAETEIIESEAVEVEEIEVEATEPEEYGEETFTSAEDAVDENSIATEEKKISTTVLSEEPLFGSEPQEPKTHILDNTWFNGSGKDKNSITRITIQKSNEEINLETKWNIDADGLVGYINNAKEAIINCPVDDTIKVESAENLFLGALNVKEIRGLENLDTSETTNFNELFCNMQKLEIVDFEDLDTSAIESAKWMFAQTDSLKFVDFSNFNPNGNKYEAKMMFYYSGLEKIDLTGKANFKGRNSTDIFSKSSNLTEVILADSDLSEYYDAYDMFLACDKLEKIDMSNCDLSNLNNSDHMFIDSFNIKELKFDGVKFPRDSKKFFYGLKNATKISISNADFSETNDIQNLFMNCESLKVCDLSNIDFSHVNNLDDIFFHCYGLEELDMSGLDLDIFKQRNTVFLIGTLVQDNWDEWDSTSRGVATIKLNNVTMSDTFTLKRLFNSDIVPFLKHIEMKGVTLPSDCTAIFKSLPVLEDIDLTDADTSNVSNASYMFAECPRLTSLDLSSFDTSNVIDFSHMFDSCSKLATITGIGNFNTENVMTFAYMFKNCNSLTNLDLSNYTTTKLQFTMGMFNGCSKLQAISLFHADKIEKMDSMFADCNLLECLDLSVIGTDNLESAEDLLVNCYGIQTLDLSTFKEYLIDASTLTNLQIISLSEEISVKAKDMNLSGNWYNATSNELVTFDDDFIQTGVVTYKKGESVNVIFDTGAGSHIPNVNVSIGSKIKFSEYKNRSKLDGYELLGWYKENTYETEITDDYIINASLTVHAKWRRIEYKINYILDSNEFAYWKDEVSWKYATPSDVRYGSDAFTLPTASDFESDGWKFVGWFDNWKLKYDKVTQIPENTFEDKTYYAKFEPKEFTISYQLNGGEWVSESSVVPYGYPSWKVDAPDKYTYGSETKLKMALKGPNDNEFLRAWYFEEDFSGTPITDYLPEKITGDLILYPKYEVRHKVIYDVNDATVGGAYAYKQVWHYYWQGQEAKASDVIWSHVLYKFIDWKDTTGKVFKVGANLGQLDKDIVLYANYNYIGLQSYERIRRTGGGSSGGGGGGGGGAISGAAVGGGGTMPSNDNKPLLPNEGLPGILAEDPTLQYQGAVQEVVPIVTNNVDSTIKGEVYVNSEGVNWEYNPMDGSWSLNNKGEKLREGFYRLTRTDDMLLNKSLVVNVYYDLDVYYFDKDGKMVTGWVNDTNGNTYFFENTKHSLSEGKMARGPVTIQGAIYYFEFGTGRMIKNSSVGGYYFGPDGKLVQL